MKCFGRQIAFHCVGENLDKVGTSGMITSDSSYVFPRVIVTYIQFVALVPGLVHGMSNPDGLELAAVADHIDHVCQLAGNTDHAAIGSDTGGRNHMPTDLQSTEDLHKIGDSLLRRGYSKSDVDKIFHGNWLRFFRQWLP